MPRPDLTRDEAEARASLVVAPAYEVDLDLTGDGDTFRSTTVVRFRAEPGSTTFITVASCPAEPVPLIAIVIRFFVQNISRSMLCSSSITCR